MSYSFHPSWERIVLEEASLSKMFIPSLSIGFCPQNQSICSEGNKQTASYNGCLPCKNNGKSIVCMTLLETSLRMEVNQINYASCKALDISHYACAQFGQRFDARKTPIFKLIKQRTLTRPTNAQRARRNVIRLLVCNLAVIWCFSVLQYFFSSLWDVPRYAYPLGLAGFLILFLINPFRKTLVWTISNNVIYHCLTEFHLVRCKTDFSFSSNEAYLRCFLYYRF